MSVFNAYMALSGAYDATVTRGERMAHRTTYRIGGPVASLVETNTYVALMRTLEVLEREKVPWTVLGRGSNVLVADAGYQGCVIRLGRELSRMDFDVGTSTVTAGGGALLAKLVTSAQGKGLSGLECCAGVPGTVGGAVRMNAGTRSEWIGSSVESIVTLRAGEGLRRRAGSEVVWDYREARIPEDEVILEATFSLSPADKALIAADMDRRLVERRQRQPIGMPSCGSVFKNPPGRSAGELVEACGLKGYAVGGAAVSEVHANFVVNEGGATASDVMAVMRHVHDVVLERHGIDLQPEVRCLGFD